MKSFGDHSLTVTHRRSEWEGTNSVGAKFLQATASAADPSSSDETMVAALGVRKSLALLESLQSSNPGSLERLVGHEVRGALGASPGRIRKLTILESWRLALAGWPRGQGTYGCKPWLIRKFTILES